MMDMRFRFGAMIVAGALAGVGLAGERYILLGGVNQGNYPGAARVVVPIPGPGAPGTFYDGDRLAGTANDGPAVVYQGVGTPLYPPNDFGALSFMYRRGSVPIGGPNRLPFMGIDFLGGPRLDLDGDGDNGSRTLIPIPDVTPVELPGDTSFIELNVSTGGGVIQLLNADMTGTNEGGPGITPGAATVLVTLAGADESGNPGAAINPSVDTRTGTLTPVIRSGVNVLAHRVDNLGFELWQDSIDTNSSTAFALGTFQYFGRFRGFVIQRDPQTGQFPTLAGHLGTSLWPTVDVSLAGSALNIPAALGGGTATIASGSGGDVYTAPNNGGLALADFGGDLGAYLDAVATPLVPGNAYRYVYLESAGAGINNSLDPVFLDTIGYDVVLIAATVCPGDVNGNGTVDQADLAALLAAYNLSDGDAGFDPNADFDQSGTVDQADLAALLSNYNTVCGG